jgi:photosystem II stability/assembly factor-like uncharacterized protein
MRARRIVASAAIGLSLASCTRSGPADQAPTISVRASPGGFGPVFQATPPPSTKPRDPDNPVVPGFWPGSVAFWNRDRGLLAGSVRSCAGCEGPTGGAVAFTKDGGATWHVVFRGGSDVGDLWVVGARTAWATVGGHHSHLIVSRDGGTTWNAAAESEGVRNATFAEASTGLATGPGGLLAWTGSGWKTIESPCGGGDVVDVVLARGGYGRGWLACDLGAGAGQQLKSIYETRDGGHTWAARTVVTPERSLGEGLGGYGYIQELSFLPGGQGWLIESRGTFYVTRDAGRSWSSPNGFQRPEIDFGTSAWRVDTLHGFALVDRTWGIVLHRTSDGGTSWARLGLFRDL